ncbi:hypothetical protein GGF46_001753 [Coemansia sp. RSA 552]|nr:hypothetical protein GGF46_001753 [Coemansia sp. RSA 552]
MRPLRADDSLDKERQRQQAQDDMSEEAEENRRERYEADSSELHDLAPKIERLDPESVPGLYPEFDLEEESNAKRDDSWYVDSDYAESEAAPLWKRRAAENLGARTAEAAVDGSMFDLCAAALREEGDITVLDVADRCEWTARMVISRAQNTRHMRAIGERLLRTIKERQRRNGVTSAIQVDGRESEDWMVVDMGRFVKQMCL